MGAREGFRVGIAGDGVAGYLVAALCRRAGCEVVHVGLGQPAPQACHVHSVDARITDLAAKLQVDLRPSPKLWHMRVVGADGAHVRNWTAPSIRRGDVERAVRTVADNPAHICIDPVSALQHGPACDLLIDATGGRRALIRAVQGGTDSEPVLEDCGRMERYSSWSGKNPSAPSGRRLTRWQGEVTLMLRETAEGWTLTRIAPAASAGASQANMDWRVGRRPGLDGPAHSTIIAATARRLVLQPAPTHGPALIAVGDALVQTSPSLGFGLLSVFQQADLMADWLSTDRATAGLRNHLDRYARSLWMQTALRALPAGPVSEAATPDASVGPAKSAASHSYG